MGQTHQVTDCQMIVTMFSLGVWNECCSYELSIAESHITIEFSGLRKLTLLFVWYDGMGFSSLVC